MEKMYKENFGENLSIISTKFLNVKRTKSNLYTYEHVNSQA
jgi:hypothetical protein